MEYKALNWTIRDEKLHKSENLSFHYTDHSFRRSQQRNLSEKDIIATLEYGTAIFKQGLIFYVLGSRKRKRNDLKNKTQNMVVVVAGDSDMIITCYKNQNPFKYIRKKTKYLC